MSLLAPKKDCVIINTRETAAIIKLDMCTIQAAMINSCGELISMHFSTGGFIFSYSDNSQCPWKLISLVIQEKQVSI